MQRNPWRKCLIVATVAAFGAVAAWAAQAPASKATGKATRKPARKASNKDLYLDQGAPPDSVKPTVKFWVERYSADSRDLDYVLNGDEEVYHTGDKVVFKFSANVASYAYLVNKGSSGKVSMLYPGPAGRDNHVPARQVRTMPSKEGAFQFTAPSGKEELCLVLSPQKIQEFEDIAEESRSRSFELNKDNQGIWDKVVKDSKVLGKSKDLVLEQDSNPSDGETPGNYVTDYGSDGFSKPISIYMSLRHEP